MTKPFPPFDLSAALPSGTTVLEASAGTGKTHTIADLAVGYLAEGVTEIEKLLVVTFSRDASRELRGRVRTALSEALGRALPTGQRDRLQLAVRDFDRASIMTIHEFCQAMASGLGILAAAPPAGTLVEDIQPLVREIAHDLYLSRYAFDERLPPFRYNDEVEGRTVRSAGAERLARDAVLNLDFPIVPDTTDGAVGQRVDFALATRDEAAIRKQRLGIYTFDDQLLRLRDCLADQQVGSICCERIRARFDVTLVDEFQDTDPVQWEILRRIFHEQRPLVLIGDPKQAIYGFRGADVRSYQRAVEAAASAASLSVNHRADGPLVRALDTLLTGLNLGRGIDVHPVAASHPNSRLTGPDGQAPAHPIRLRLDGGNGKVDRIRARVAADVVAQLRDLLGSGLQLADGAGRRPVEPSDIAIVVRANKTGLRVTEALRAAGIPVAFSGSESIFTSVAARDYASLLSALANPRPAAVRAAVRTAFFGGSLADLASAEGEQLGEWTAALRRWERVLSRAGVAALFATIAAENDFSTRVLSRSDGERTMTDFRHLSQLLHELTGPQQPSAAWLSEWLAEQIQSASAATERTRRLETDAQAVQVKTVHKSKGLQFPIVLLPDLWDRFKGEPEDKRLLIHTEDDTRVLDLGGSRAPGRQERQASADAEEDEDTLRTLYVAFTRAKSQVLCWWAASWNTESSSLQRVLFRSREDGSGTPRPTYPLETFGYEALSALPWLRGSAIAVEDIQPGLPAPALPAPAIPQLRAETFSRLVDPHWRRTSYSGLTAAAHADFGILADEPVPEPVDFPDVAPSAPASPMAALPGGTEFGTLVHAVFEQVEPVAGSPEELRDRIVVAARELLPRFPVPDTTAEALADALLPSFRTPLGPLTGNRAIADIAASDRLTELDFEMPIGDRNQATLAQVAGLLAKHLPDGDPLAGYPVALAEPELAAASLRGFLTGSIDAVLRVRPGEHDRFVVVDYKTNRLGPEDLTLAHYDQASMAQAMQQSHYPLQAVLYCVALHRFLSVRLPGYLPEQHLGGVLYLFVRGMSGPEPLLDGGLPTGVFAWSPPVALVVELSALLSDRGSS